MYLGMTNSNWAIYAWRYSRTVKGNTRTQGEVTLWI